MKKLIVSSLIASSILISGSVKTEKEIWDCRMWKLQIEANIQKMPYDKAKNSLALEELYSHYLYHLEEGDLEFAQVYERAMLLRLYYDNNQHYNKIIKAMKVLLPQNT